MKYLYIVDHYCPSSGDGGVWHVIAENDQECFDLISNDYTFHYSDYEPLLRDTIIDSDSYELAGDYESGVVGSFIT